MVVTKKRSFVDPFVVVPEQFVVLEVTKVSINDNSKLQISALKSNTDYKPSSFDNINGSKTVELNDAYDLVPKSNKEKGEIMEARFVGGYKNNLTYLLKTHKQKEKKFEGKVTIIGSYDGTVHKRNTKSDSSIISFSSKFVLEEILKEKGVTASNSMNILTRQQKVYNENPQNIFLLIRNVYQSKKVLRERKITSDNEIQYNFKECHNEKMFYCLMQHFLFNRKQHPFLLCSCIHGAGVIDGA